MILTTKVMNRIEIGSTGEFALEGENFVIDVPMTGRQSTTSETFAIAKSEPFIRTYENLALTFSPRSILELGIFQGGSYVLLDRLFKPHRMSAVDIRRKPVEPLLRYVSGKKDRFVHFATSQSDRQALEQIVLGELANELDLVVDDASHTYEETKASFEILFPLLQPGGWYVIEDWSWAHAPQYQGPDAHLAQRSALSNLLFEQLMLLGSTLMIAEIRVWKFLYLIRKSRAPLESSIENGSVFDRTLNRGKKWSLI